MENKTVKELREIAKERKIKYYYKLRREDLMRALQPVVQRPVPAPRPIVQRTIPAPRPIRSILDEPIPSSASSPVLAPEPKNTWEIRLIQVNSQPTFRTGMQTLCTHGL